MFKSLLKSSSHRVTKILEKNCSIKKGFWYTARESRGVLLKGLFFQTLILAKTFAIKAALFFYNIHNITLFYVVASLFCQVYQRMLWVLFSLSLCFPLVHSFDPPYFNLPANLVSWKEKCAILIYIEIVFHPYSLQSQCQKGKSRRENITSWIRATETWKKFFYHGWHHTFSWMLFFLRWQTLLFKIPPSVRLPDLNRWVLLALRTLQFLA